MKQSFLFASLAVGAAFLMPVVPGDSALEAGVDSPIRTAADDKPAPVKKVTPEELLTLGREKLETLEAVGDWKIAGWLARAMAGRQPEEIQKLLAPAIEKASSVSGKSILTAFADAGKTMNDVTVSPELVSQAAELLAYKKVPDVDGKRAEGLARYAANACDTVDPVILRKAISKGDEPEEETPEAAAPEAPRALPPPSPGV